MENHHLCSENSPYSSPCSIAMLNYQRVNHPLNPIKPLFSYGFPTVLSKHFFVCQNIMSTVSINFEGAPTHHTKAQCLGSKFLRLNPFQVTCDPMTCAEKRWIVQNQGGTGDSIKSWNHETVFLKNHLLGHRIKLSRFSMTASFTNLK